MPDGCQTFGQWHPGIEEEHVGLVLTHQPDSILAIARFRGDLNLRCLAERCLQPRAQHGIAVGNDHPCLGSHRPGQDLVPGRGWGMNLDLEAGSPARPGLDGHVAVQAPGALIHPGEPDAADVPQVGQVGWWLESDAIVGDGQQQLLACPAQADAYLTSLRMLLDITKCLAQVGQDLTASPGGRRALGRQLQTDVDAGEHAPSGGDAPHLVDECFFPQIADDTPGIRDGTPGQPGQLA